MSITTPMRGRPMTTGTTADDEIFERMNINAFVTLALQSAQAVSEQRIVIEACRRNGIQDLEASTTMSALCDARPYLLLDVRPADEFVKNHIITAQNYPHTLISRVNAETVTMMAYKNRPGNLIVCYDEAERNSPRVVTTFLQRGYDNVVLLTGGLTMAHMKYPTGLITGAWQPLDQSMSSKVSKTPASTPLNEVLDTEFTEAAMESLREQLQHNILPKAARSRLVQPTSAAKARRDAIEQEKQNASKVKPWK